MEKELNEMEKKVNESPSLPVAERHPLDDSATRRLGDS